MSHSLGTSVKASSRLANFNSHQFNVLKQWRSWAVTLLAAVFFVTAIASFASPAQAAEQGYYNRRDAAGHDANYKAQKGLPTNLYDEVQPKTDNMNQHNDDFRYDANQSKRKADKLIGNAERNIQKNVTPGSYASPARDTGERIQDKLGEIKDDISANTQSATEDLKQGVEKAGRNVKATAKDVKQSIESTVRETGKKTERALDDAADQIKDVTRDTTKAASRSLENTKDKTQDATKAVSRSLEETKNKVDDKLAGGYYSSPRSKGYYSMPRS
ncbi:MAG: hypothetical protein MUF49_32700 [Oculatellaceae cyanobacterium Prado106]|jgi:gas vesicle protein|nr:hypothetical protein [Oculatellaceae cyanobacterium Prado106]